MKALNNFVKTALSAGAIAIGALMTASANAGTFQLGFVVDESGSISPNDWNIIRAGLANAIGTIPLLTINGNELTRYEISVVTFDSNAQTRVNHVMLNNAADRAAVVNTVATMTQGMGATNYQAGLDAIRIVMGVTAGPSDTSYVNLVTDGEPNFCSTGSTTLENAQACAITARDQLISAGIDNISIEGIGISADSATFLQNSICYPGPCDLAAPYNFPAQGFYIPVANATQYAVAIQNKIDVVIGRVPEPGSLAMIAAGMVGLLAARRNRADA